MHGLRAIGIAVSCTFAAPIANAQQVSAIDGLITFEAPAGWVSGEETGSAIYIEPASDDEDFRGNCSVKFGDLPRFVEDQNMANRVLSSMPPGYTVKAPDELLEFSLADVAGATVQKLSYRSANIVFDLRRFYIVEKGKGYGVAATCAVLDEEHMVREEGRAFLDTLRINRG